jgi:uncharacterized protein YecA (UPF0149 family)
LRVSLPDVAEQAELAAAAIERGEIPYVLVDDLTRTQRVPVLTQELAQRLIDKANQYEPVNYRDSVRTKPIVNVRQKIGRNDKCGCGSGKKFKHCHYGTSDGVLTEGATR